MWLSVDPLAEMFPGRSPYEYCFSNPINLTDPTGMSPEGGGPTPKEAAQMSSDVYNTKNNKYKNDATPEKIDGGWTLSNKDFGITVTEDKSGFNSAIYERNVGSEKEPKMEYVYVTQGSDFDNGGNDWSENGNQAVGKYSRQYELSTDNAEKLKAKIGDSLSFAGHSLGGGLASANALKTGLDATTFNAAGLHKNTKSRHDLNKKANINAFIVEGEMVHVSQKLLGLKAEGKHTYLPATYIPMWTVRFAPPPVKAGVVLANVVASAYNHTMGSVLSKMK
jgi:hypothetical protein